MGNVTQTGDARPELLRRDATSSPLHTLVREHLETFLARFEDEHGGRPIPRLVDPAVAVRSAQTVVPAPDDLVAESDGYSLHAATRIEAEDRDRLERLVRYVARPPLAQGRLEVRGDGKVKWSLRRPWRDGTRAFVFDPMTKR